MKPFEKNVKILTGLENSGKSYAAKIMKLAFKKPFHRIADAEFFRTPFPLHGVDNDTDLILIDDVQKKDLQEVVSTFTEPYLRIIAKNKTPKVLETPRVIITLMDASADDLSFLQTPYLSRRVDVLECSIFENDFPEVSRVNETAPVV